MKQHMKKRLDMVKDTGMGRGFLFLILSALLIVIGITVPVQAKEAKDTRPDYKINVNTALNCVTVMQQNTDGTETAVKAMACSCGKEGHETPLGTFKTSSYYDWRLLVDGSYGRYAVRFNNKILFHSVPYFTKSVDSLEWEQFNMLGEAASLGCVRLAVSDITWIYENCKPGTTVVVYADTTSPGPLGKPESVKIDAASVNKGYDPTEITALNPWLNQQKTLGTLETFNYMDYANQYPDIKAVYGYNKEALYKHYVTYGFNENRIATFTQ